MESHTKTIVNEENKSRAYKELIKELEEELENKPKEIERLEIEYFKKYLLDFIREGSYMEELKELEEKIDKEKSLSHDLRHKINMLKVNFDEKYGK